jgi:hypothetical protein
MADVCGKTLKVLKRGCFAYSGLRGTVTALFLIAQIQATSAQNKAPTISIPEIAKIGKVQIGYSTQEELARKWGNGKTIIGGHPNSGRVWRIAGTDWRLQTDGFEYSERGLVVDEISLFSDSGPAGDIPAARLSKKDFFWLGEISLGMSKTELLTVLKQRSLSNTLTADGFEIHAEGFSPLTSVNTPFRKWTATLTFSHDILVRLDLSAQTNS